MQISILENAQKIIENSNKHITKTAKRKKQIKMTKINKCAKIPIGIIKNQTNATFE